MTPDELKSIRRSLGLTADAFAALVRVANGRTVRKWEAGDRDIPGPVTILAEGMRDSAAVRKWMGVSLKEPKQAERS